MLVSRSQARVAFTHPVTHTQTHTEDGNSSADRHVRPAELEASVAVESHEKAVRTLLNISKLKAAKRKTSVNKSWSRQGITGNVEDQHCVCLLLNSNYIIKKFIFLT